VKPTDQHVPQTVSAERANPGALGLEVRRALTVLAVAVAAVAGAIAVVVIPLPYVLPAQPAATCKTLQARSSSVEAAKVRTLNPLASSHDTPNSTCA
jgi:hypothetical protein